LLALGCHIQGGPGVKGHSSRADSESKTSYTRGPNSQQLRSDEFFKVQ